MSKQNQGEGIRNRVRQLLGIRKGQTPGLVLDNPKSEDVVCSAEILLVSLLISLLLSDFF